MLDPITGEEFMDNIIKDHVDILEPKITEQYMDDFKKFIYDKTTKYSKETNAARKQLTANILQNEKMQKLIKQSVPYVQVLTTLSMLASFGYFINNTLNIIYCISGIILLLFGYILLAIKYGATKLERFKKLNMQTWLEKQREVVKKIVTIGLANDSLERTLTGYVINARISDVFVNRYITQNPDALSDEELNTIKLHMQCMSSIGWTAKVNASVSQSDSQ